jgi:hypothetical protein
MNKNIFMNIYNIEYDADTEGISWVETAKALRN